MNTRNLILLAILAVLYMMLASCAVNTTDAHVLADKSGYTTELDEPSARGQLRRISPEQSHVMYRFTLSLDEKSIVYSGVQAGGGDKILQLWKISSDGSGGSPVKITSGGSDDYFYPSFTKDGQFIVYESGGLLWKVRSDGAGGKMRIPGSGSGTDTAPHVSVNDKLVFCSAQSQGSGTNQVNKFIIWTCNLDGGELTQIKEGMFPRWSPDGEKIVFVHDGEIWTVHANGTSLMQLTNTRDFSESLPSYSPDGKRIVYTSNEGKQAKISKSINIWSMHADGSGKTQITELDSWDSWPIWGNNGVYFLSGRAQKNNEYIQRIWLLKM